VLIEIHSLKKKKKHATNTNGGLVSKKHSHEKHEAYGDVFFLISKKKKKTCAKKLKTHVHRLLKTCNNLSERPPIFFVLSDIFIKVILTTSSPNPGYADSIGTTSIRKAHPP
jgi:hypothetical protein